MKKLTIIIIAFSIAFSFTRCNTSHEKVASDQVELRLDDGKKWEANTEMHDGFVQMQNRVEDFTVEEHSLSDYKKLGEELQNMVNDIVDKCTMKGDGHEELHKLLIPVIKNIKDLQEGDEANAKQAVDEMEKLLKKYFDYFTIEKNV